MVTLPNGSYTIILIDGHSRSWLKPESGISRPAAVTALYWVLEASPTAVVRWFMWRTWGALIADIGADQQFWAGAATQNSLHRTVEGASCGGDGGDQGLRRPLPAYSRRAPSRLAQPVLVLQSEQDRASLHRSVNEIRAVYQGAIFRTQLGLVMALCSRTPTNTYAKSRLS